MLNPDPLKVASLEEELARRARQQAVVAHLGQRALLRIDLLSLLEEAAVLVARTLEVEYCEVLQLLPGDKRLHLLAGFGWREGTVGRAIVDAELASQAGYTLTSSEPVIVEDLRAETRFNAPALLLEHNVVSGMTVVIAGREQPFGVLGAHATQHKVFTQDDINFLQSMANVLAAAIDRMRIEDSLKALNETLEKRVAEETGYIRLLQEVAMAANEAASVEEALQFVLDRICAHTGWPVGHVYGPAGEELLPLLKRGEVATEDHLLPSSIWFLRDPKRFQIFRQVTESTPLARGAGLPGRVYATGQPAWISDVTRDPNFPRAGLASDLGVKAGFAFPVMVKREIVAIPEFFTDQAIPPDERLLDVVAQIGTQLGRVIERKRAESVLRSRENQLAEAQRLSQIGSWDWDIPSDRVSWSEELYRIYGLDPQDFSASFADYMDLIHPEDRQHARQVIERALQDRQPFEFRHRIVRPDGAVRILQAQGKVILGEGGQPVKMLGTGQDITERVKLEEALRESLVMLESLFESAPDGTVLVDEEGTIVRLNRQVETLFGYSREELLGKSLEILLPERFQEGRVRHRSNYFQDPRLRMMGVGLELYGRRKDGTEFPVDIMLSPMQTERGQLVIAMVRDITDRKRAAELLRQSEARFRSIFESSALGIALVDAAGRVLILNPRLGEMLGYPADQLVGKDLLELTHPADMAFSRRLFDELLAGERDHYQVEKRFIGRDGRLVWGNFTVSLIRSAEGKPRFAVKMIEDITARKQMEAELAEVQRRLLEGREIERVQLAQELHDEPIQDLYGILYQMNDLAESISGESGQKQLASVRSTVQLVIHTLRAMCGELRSPTLAPFGLEGAIREHAEGFQEKYPELKIHLDLEYDGETLPEGMRLNLFRIYQQAMNNIVRHAHASNVWVRFQWDEQSVLLQIQDNGRGFEVPKRWIGLVREGHLGLVGAAERAEIIGGRFKVDSTPGKGTFIEVVVPRNQEQASNEFTSLG